MQELQGCLNNEQQISESSWDVTPSSSQNQACTPGSCLCVQVTDASIQTADNESCNSQSLQIAPASTFCGKSCQATCILPSRSKSHDTVIKPTENCKRIITGTSLQWHTCDPQLHASRQHPMYLHLLEQRTLVVPHPM